MQSSIFEHKTQCKEKCFPQKRIFLKLFQTEDSKLQKQKVT